MGAELFRVNGRTDGRTDEHDKLIVDFRNFAKAPKNNWHRDISSLNAHVFFTDVSLNWNVTTYFSPKYEISLKSASFGSSWHMRTDTTKLTVAFRYAKAPKNELKGRVVAMHAIKEYKWYSSTHTLSIRW